MLKNDYGRSLRTPRRGQGLVEAISHHFATAAPETPQVNKVGLDAKTAMWVDRIYIERWDLTNDPRISRPDEPLIIFSTQHAVLRLGEDIPAMVAERLEAKRNYSENIPAWLLLWSNHFSLRGLADAIEDEVDRQVMKSHLPYERVFYLHLHWPNFVLVECGVSDESQPLLR
jgi:hypothetical protein